MQRYPKQSTKFSELFVRVCVLYHYVLYCHGELFYHGRQTPVSADRAVSGKGK